MSSDARRGDWTQTYTGGQFWPLDPRVVDVRLVDITHALGNVCRFGGHVQEFYSVAEHSLRVADLVPPELRLQALLHDAAEAYCGDVVRPLKRHLRDYEEVEAGVARCIGEKYGVDLVALHPLVVKADNEILAVEFRDLLEPRDDRVLPEPPRGVRIFETLTPRRASRLLQRALVQAGASDQCRWVRPSPGHDDLRCVRESGHESNHASEYIDDNDMIWKDPSK